ncbi:MAG: hypothetical protein MK078_01945 [Crocinitomicaceae bacterium]|nr:hypothetical protein [Crocinitomicaceae bacterium]
MEDKNPIDDLKEIRKIMEKSTKFISLSGLSGVFAGITALVGVWIAYDLIETFSKKAPFYYAQGRMEEGWFELDMKLFALAGIVLVLALSFGVLFTWLKARKNNQKILTPMGFRLALSVGVPLFFGGVFCFGLWLQGVTFLIIPSMLIFYGMSLLNGSKYVHNEIKYLAGLEMILGTLALFNPANMIYYWATGFGVLHIVYGTIMYFKYDYKK